MDLGDGSGRGRDSGGEVSGASAKKANGVLGEDGEAIEEKDDDDTSGGREASVDLDFNAGR